MIAFASPDHRPTMQELVRQYVEVGITSRNAVHYVVDCQMRRGIARGKGRKASRRASEAVYARALEIGRDIEALNVRMAANRKRWAADAMAERYTEGRRSRVHDMGQVINFHD